MDVEKTMQFILEQQAAFSGDLVEQKNRLTTLGEHVRMLATTAEHMLAVQQEHESWLARLTEAQTRLAEVHAQSQARNDDAINVLIRTVQDILPRLPKQ